MQHVFTVRLCGVQEFEDRNQLAGYIMMVNGSYNRAQDLFMKSSNPKLALEVRQTQVMLLYVAWCIEHLFVHV